MQYVTDVDTQGFAAQVIERSHEVPVIVDFWAEWCGPCKVLGPAIEKVVEEAGGQVVLAKVDVDQNQQLAGQFGVQGIPTVVAFKDGEPVSRFTGAIPEDAIREFVGQLAPTETERTVAQAEAYLEAGDEAAAEQLLQSVLDADPSNQDAGVVMAGLLLDRDDVDGALALLDTLSPTDEVQQLQAAARMTAAEDIDVDAVAEALAADPNDHGAALDMAKAEAARGETEAALERLLGIVEAKTDVSDDARKAMLDIFELRGHSDPLVTTFRQRLATAIF